MDLYKLNSPCGNTECEKLFDGVDCGLYCYSKATFVSLDILFAFTSHFVRTGYPNTTFSNSVASDYLEFKLLDTDEVLKEFMSPVTFRKVWAKFAKFLKRPYQFQCPNCKRCPKILICDGTSQRIKKTGVSCVPITRPSGPVAAGVVARRNTRCFCSVPTYEVDNSNSCKDLLKEFADWISTDCCNASVSPYSGIDELQSVASGYQIGSLMMLLHNHSGQLEPNLRRKAGRFILELSSPSPVVVYFHPDVAQVIGHHIGVFGGTQAGAAQPCLTDDHMQLLQHRAPLLYGLLQCVWSLPDKTPGVICSELHGLLNQLVVRATHSTAAVGGTYTPGQPVIESLPSCDINSPNNFIKTGVCVGLPLVRDRPPYPIDQTSEEVQLDGCRHDSHGSSRSAKTGGIFTWFCPHGVCYGFYIIPEAEGRNDAFSFLIKYFDEAPLVVIYDFACLLQEYCLNREPLFFKNTRFYVDRFHWFNHTCCARSYNIDLYDDVLLDTLNTQVAEQWNAKLKTIKSSATKMSQELFMVSLRLFLDFWNEKKIKYVNAVNAQAARYTNTVQTQMQLAVAVDLNAV